jgi:Lar family restriction alleviation protein
MSELKPCPFCGNERVNVAEIAGSFFAVCGTCGAQGKQRATISGAVGTWNRRAGDEPEGKAVNVGEVPVFPNATADKEQAKKVLEEAAEVFGAWQDMSCGISTESEVVEEIADLITASCNLASALGFDDLRPAVEECRRRNEERGRF